MIVCCFSDGVCNSHSNWLLYYPSKLICWVYLKQAALITLESKRTQAAEMSEVLPLLPLLVVGGVKLMASWSHGLHAHLMMDLLVTSFLPPLVAKWYVNLCPLFILMCWTKLGWSATGSLWHCLILLEGTRHLPQGCGCHLRAATISVILFNPLVIG